MAKKKYRKPASRYSLSTLRSMHMSRSPRSIMMDNKIDAKKQFKHTNKKGVDQWIKYPHQYDIIGVDNVSASYSAFNTFKTKHTKKRTKKKPVQKRTQKTKNNSLSVKYKPVVKRASFKKSKHGKSKSRIARERMTFSDIHERNMAKRLRKKTGMTHIQISHLIHQGKQSDYIDIETVVGSVAGHSKHKDEVYEAAQKKIREQVNKRKNATELYADDVDDLEMMYASQAEEYYG